MAKLDIEPFCLALQELREKTGLTQEEVAHRLGIGRKTYFRIENGYHFPIARERAHYVKRLHELDPRASQALVSVLGETLMDYVIVQQPAGPPKLDDAQAKGAFDAAVYAAADALDMTPRAVRSVAAALLENLAGTGVTVGQGAAAAKAGLAAKKG